MGLAWILPTLTQRAREWKTPLVVGSIDVPVAFDNMRHDAVALAMQKKRIEIFTVAWLLYSLRAMKIQPELGELSLEAMQMCDGLPQGNKTPTVFTMTLGPILHPVWTQLSTDGAGLAIRGPCSAVPCV